VYITSSIQTIGDKLAVIRLIAKNAATITDINPTSPETWPGQYCFIVVT
jgi:hypothetical protein